MNGARWRSGQVGDVEAPAVGERFAPLVEHGAFVVEEIVSSAEVEPARYEQDHDEWVLVVEGSARVRVADDVVELGPRSWLWLPAGVVHVVEEVEPGTRWLAIHLPPTGSDFGAAG